MNFDLQHSNIAEEEMGQLHAIHLNENAIAAVRAAMPTGPSRLYCTDCGDKIPDARRALVQGCQRCYACQSEFEHL